MNNSEQEIEQEVFLPRWVAIPIGLIFGLFVLPCIIGAISLIIIPGESAAIARPIAGIVLFIMCCWVLEKCFRLVTNKKVKGGLFSPKALRAIAWFFLFLPVSGFFTGYVQEKPLIAAIQACAYVSIFFGLRRLAVKRERNAA